MSIIKSLSMENPDIYDEYIILLFKSYESQKRKGGINNIPNNENIAKNLIKMYYTANHEQSNFDNILDSFKKKHIIQESQVENVHKKEERVGLSLLYDFLTQEEINKFSKNLITLILKMHNILFSATPHGQNYGGSFRTYQVYLPGSGIDIPEPDRIIEELLKICPLYNEIYNEGLKLSNSDKKEKEILSYIHKCLELKAKLIEIHPFENGNGRVTRTLVNYLFKLPNIPPIYVKKSEKAIYQAAMNKAIVKNDFSAIDNYYFNKICDSIYELDISLRGIEQKNKTK